MTDPQNPARDARGSSSARDARGRFQPGASGNPAGKKPGTLNHATRWGHLLAEGDFDTIAGHILELARKGDFRAARFLLDRLDPRPRGRPVELEFAPGASLLERFAAVSQALAAGEITPEEARTVALTLDLEGRERARCAAADASVMRHRAQLSKAEFYAALERLDVLFPLDLPSEPDLHSTCNSSPGAPTPTQPGAGPGMAAAGSDRAAALLHPASISEPAAEPTAPRPRAANRLRAAMATDRRAR